MYISNKTNFKSKMLKSLALASVIALGSASMGSAQDLRASDKPAKCGSHTPQVQVTVHNVTSSGLLTVELYRPSKNAFLRKSSRETRVRVKARAGSQTVCFNVKGPGRYALAAYNDTNGNRKLERKLNQLPAEPFALSSNKPLKMEFPKFEDSAFNVPASGAKVNMYLQSR